MTDSLVHITAVEILGDNELRLSFEDGTVGDVKFDRDEWRGVLAPLRDPEVFARVSVDAQLGTVVWPGGLDLAPEPLYEEARRRAVLDETFGIAPDFPYPKRDDWDRFDSDLKRVKH
jgi:Protein of unknown function (DUF2442)